MGCLNTCTERWYYDQTRSRLELNKEKLQLRQEKQETRLVCEVMTCRFALLVRNLVVYAKLEVPCYM
jgi:hypothetical protein